MDTNYPSTFVFKLYKKNTYRHYYKYNCNNRVQNLFTNTVLGIPRKSSKSIITAVPIDLE